MDKKNITKNYTNGEITVVWQSGKCTYSGICSRNLPNVFKPREKPWIKIEKASSSEIIETVKKCPSGALTYFRNDEKKEE